MRRSGVRSSCRPPTSPFRSPGPAGPACTLIQPSPIQIGSAGTDLSHHGRMHHIKTSWPIALLTLLCCSLPAVSPRADAAPFVIEHDVDYARVTLPSTLGQRTQVEWGLASDFGMWLSL